MLDKPDMNMILELKQQGYSQSEILAYFTEHNLKAPSRPTIAKYFKMDAAPPNPGEKLEKDKAFDKDPFKPAIIAIIERCSANNLRVSSIYDVLTETFVEGGECETLPGNEQTLRNYVRYLKESGQVNFNERSPRVYDHVFDTPPGEQMLIDFGEWPTKTGKKIHFICLLLRYSRYLCVYAQDRPFTSVDACSAIYKSFCKIGGRPKMLVIDQDAVFIKDETAGDLTLTQALKDLCEEQGLEIWACRKADPESKGPIENSVGFLKKSFFSARVINDLADVNRSLPGWLKRQNSRVHRATYCIPQEILETYEKSALRELIPSVFETSPNSLTEYNVPSQPYVQYKTNKYSVPREYAYKKVLYKAVGNKLYIYDLTGTLLCSHTLSECKGQHIQLEEHKKPEAKDWIPIMERMRGKWNCYDFQHFINGVKKENPRYIAEQLALIEHFLDNEHADRALVAELFKECCQHLKYKFKQVRSVYDTLKASHATSRHEPTTTVLTGDVDHAALSDYQMRFDHLADNDDNGEEKKAG